MPIVSAMTELEAVNEMLMSIGQAPVNSLAVSGIKDVAIARARLDTALRQILSRGWAFNTDTGYTFNPDVDGHIVPPATALKVKSESANVVLRRHPTKGLALYDADGQTFEFSEPLSCTVVWLFQFEDIPQTARHYIATVAARRFQSKAIGSQILDRFEEEDEMKAWIALEREERAVRKTNIFRGNPAISGFGNRSY